VTWWYLTGKGMTVAVATTNGRIVKGPPIVRRFIGQPLGNLARWLGCEPLMLDIETV